MYAAAWRVLYRSKSIPPSPLQFGGRVRISVDPTESNLVFGLAHQKERASDPERKGRAVIVDLDEVKLESQAADLMLPVALIGDAGHMKLVRFKSA